MTDHQRVTAPQQHGIETEVALLRHELETLTEIVDKQTEQMAELLEAWQAATGFLAFMKGLGKLAAGVGALFALWQSFRH